MSRGLIIGYHGCGRQLGFKVVAKEAELIPNNLPYHWLGDGIYFWENDPHRALEWAQEKVKLGQLKDEPYVIGAVIDLKRCLDLHIRENQLLLKRTYGELAAIARQAGKPLPKNKTAKNDKRKDKVLRYLDCLVINDFVNATNPPFDTVRGLFVEGKAIYPGANLYHKTHSEIAVRNRECIVGYFHPERF